MFKWNEQTKELLIAAAIAIVLAFILPEAWAGEKVTGSVTNERLTLSCCSWHKKDGYNEFNPGIGMEFDITPKTSWSVHAAINSYSNVALYGTITWKPLQIGRARLGVIEVCAIGYESGRLSCFMPAPILEYQYAKGQWIEVMGGDTVLVVRFKLAKGVLE